MKKRRKNIFIFLGYCGVLIGLIWLIGFCVFILYAVHFKYLTSSEIQGIAVLTGGVDRIDTAIKLMEEKNVEKLLISGINKKVPTETVLKKIGEAKGNITLGYVAENTKGNAEEVALWAKEKNISKVLLVTSFYHMPRSLSEISYKSPELSLSPYPVFPYQMKESVSWIHTRSAWLLFVEYHKFIFIYAKRILEKELKKYDYLG